MATRESRGMGIAHLTVVPENLEVDPAAEDAGPAPDAAASTADADGDGA